MGPKDDSLAIGAAAGHGTMAYVMAIIPSTAAPNRVAQGNAVECSFGVQKCS